MFVGGLSWETSVGTYHFMRKIYAYVHDNNDNVSMEKRMYQLL